MNEISITLTGYSIMACCILCAVYLLSLPAMAKTHTSKIACTVLMVGLALVQIVHLAHFLHGTEPLSHRAYTVLLAIIPIAFYFFSREVLFHGEKPAPKDLAHGTLILAALVLPLHLATLLTFITGYGYALGIYLKIKKLRTHVPRFQFERFFYALFLAMTVMALLLGLTVQILEPGYYYHGYAACISVAMVLIVAALLFFPDLLSDVLLASETVYAKSKLEKVDVNRKQQELENLMSGERLYENEDLTLADVADQLDLSPHQLSELVNSHFGMSFPRFIRRHRIDAAKEMLVTEPGSSVLSIAMAIGFKSQSTFYTAFKDHTGQAPAVYRKANLS